MTMNKLEAAQEAAEYIREAIHSINRALAVMQQNGLDLVNYPDYWHEFSEHPLELSNMLITDSEDIQVQVGD
jgi:hypothetical protein